MAVEHKAGRPLSVFATPEVILRLREHRCHELLSTGRDPDDWASWVPCPDGRPTVVVEQLRPGPSGRDGDITIEPIRAQHSGRNGTLTDLAHKKPLAEGAGNW